MLIDHKITTSSGDMLEYHRTQFWEDMFYSSGTDGKYPNLCLYNRISGSVNQIIRHFWSISTFRRYISVNLGYRLYAHVRLSPLKIQSVKLSLTGNLRDFSVQNSDCNMYCRNNFIVSPTLKSTVVVGRQCIILN